MASADHDRAGIRVAPTADSDSRCGKTLRGFRSATELTVVVPAYLDTFPSVGSTDLNTRLALAGSLARSWDGLASPTSR